MDGGGGGNFFKLSRGVRQGCLLSPYLFIISAEILATVIRASPNIKGIIVKNTEIRLCQYADDTTLTLDGSEKSFQEALSMLETFGNVFGLRLNYKKTEAFWIAYV